MNIVNPVRVVKKLLRWSILAGLVGGAAVLAGPAKAFIEQQLMPFGLVMPPLAGQSQVDPRVSIEVAALGLGTHISKAELYDGEGKLVARAEGQLHASIRHTLAFGSRYTLKATAERGWSKQNESRELSFTTVQAPKLEGPSLRMLAPDASVTLHFDQAIGAIQAKGDLRLTAETDASGQTVRLQASDYAQDTTYPVQLEWQTATGVPLPPISLELTTAPALTAESNVKGMTNLGTALPLQLRFSEALADRANVGKNIRVRSADGLPIAGYWAWQGQQRLQFTPKPGWPASSTIEVSIEPQALKTVRGGTLEKTWVSRFSTGIDRRLVVYLDAQRLSVLENGQEVRSFKVSTGKAKTPTVTGDFYIYDRYVHKTMRSDVGRGQKGFYEVENVPYTQFFHKDFAFHGAFWHNNFGHPASHGCVNMATKDHNSRWPSAPEDAGWLYRWAALGVPVTVLKETPPTIAKLPAEGSPAAPGKGEAPKAEGGSQPSALPVSDAAYPAPKKLAAGEPSKLPVAAISASNATP